MISINLSNITISDITGLDYPCIISLISNEAIHLLQNDDLIEKKWKIIKNVK